MGLGTVSVPSPSHTTTNHGARLAGRNRTTDSERRQLTIFDSVGETCHPTILQAGFALPNRIASFSCFPQSGLEMEHDTEDVWVYTGQQGEVPETVPRVAIAENTTRSSDE
eukprot:scaffold9657_cov131-Cylindrotheca_fusiformis.AAC.1